MKRSPAPPTPSQQQIDPHLLAIEINALRVAEIAALRRECAFWRERCRLLEAVAESDGIRKRAGASNSRCKGRVVPAATP